jgi:hypothetical protein
LRHFSRAELNAKRSQNGASGKLKISAKAMRASLSRQVGWVSWGCMTESHSVKESLNDLEGRVMHPIAIERGRPMCAIGQKRTFHNARSMTAIPPKSGHPQALNNSFYERRMSSARDEQSLSFP